MMTTPNTAYLTGGIVQGNVRGDGLPVTPGALYTPATFVASPAPQLPASILDYLSDNPRSNIGWIRQAFMLNTLPVNGVYSDISTQDMARRIFTKAAWDYNDTTLGGNWAINAVPQFTEFADITMGGDLGHKNAPTRTSMTTSQSYGEGRIYNEVIDANAQLITMSFGVQAFNSLTSFFGNMYDPEVSQLVKTGRGKGILFQLAKGAGYLLAVPFIPLIFGSNIIKNLLNIPATKFSYFKPTMPLYWNSVNTMLNGITANLGVHVRELNTLQKAMYDDPTGTSSNGSDIESEMALMGKFLPDIYQPINGSYANGAYIDAYAVASRSQRLADAFTKRIQQALNSAASMQDLQTRMQQAISGNLSPSTLTNTSLSTALLAYLNGPGGNVNSGPTNGSGTVDNVSASSTQSASTSSGSTSNGGTSGNTGTGAPLPMSSVSNATPDSNGTPSQAGHVAGWWSQFSDSFRSDIADGSNFITFRTNYGAEIQESFSNSMRQSDIQQKINSFSSEARSTSFDLAGGNITSGILGSAINGIKSAVGDIVTGALAGLQLSGLAALGGSAYVDIPMMYDSSEATLPQQTFNIELRSWSGHKLALLQNIYFPLACLLAAVLPRATGASSWSAPFCCQIFAQGRLQIRNGMVTDMSISRGVGNIGFSPQTNLPLAIDVSFTVRDFSSMVYMPIIATTGFVSNAIMAAGQATGAVVGALTGNSGDAATGENVASALTSGPYTDASIFSDYLAVLSALGWRDQIYPMRRWSIARDKAVLDYETFKSPYHAAGWTAGTFPGLLISSLVQGSDRP